MIILRACPGLMPSACRSDSLMDPTTSRLSQPCKAIAHHYFCLMYKYVTFVMDDGTTTLLLEFKLEQKVA
jgi:hypothetical protein